MERLAVPSSHWKEAWGPRVERAEHWTRFTALREMIVVVDEVFEKKIARFEKERREVGGHYYTPAETWYIPNNIPNALEKGREMRPEVKWRVPDVRAVRDESEILEGTNMQFKLRCFPCPDLNDPGLLD